MAVGALLRIITLLTAVGALITLRTSTMLKSGLQAPLAVPLSQINITDPSRNNASAVSRPSLRPRPTVVSVQFSNVNGRHSNQLKGVLHGIFLADGIAKRLASAHADASNESASHLQVRVVLPPFKQRGEVHDFGALYDTAALRASIKSPISIVESSAERRDVGASAPQLLEIVCLHRRGIASAMHEMPLLPRDAVSPSAAYKGAQPRCTSDVTLTSRDPVDVVSAAVVAINTARRSRQQDGVGLFVVVYFYETLYYDGISFGTDGVALNFWQGLRPSTAIANHVSALRKRHTNVFFCPRHPNIAVGDASLRQRPLVAVHVRSLEGSCRDRLVQMQKRRKFAVVDAAPAPSVALSWQCQLTNASTIFEHLSSAVDSDQSCPEGVVLAGDDTGALQRVRERLAAISGIEAILVATRGNRLVDALVDFWVMANASSSFVGNVASTLSRHICLWRRANVRTWSDGVRGDCAGFSLLDGANN